MVRHLRLDPRLIVASRRARRRSLFVVLLLLIGVGTVALLGGNDSEEVSPFAGALEGMKGTRPIATRDEVFHEQVNLAWLSMDPANRPLQSFEYAAEAYDAVIIAALAAEAAGTDGSDLADYLVGVTVGDTPCTSFDECRDLLWDGIDIDYQGASGRLDLNPQGENVITNFSVVEFGGDNRIDETRSRYVELIGSLDAPGAPQRRVEREGDGYLTIGSLLPITGQLAPYAPAQQAAIRLAITEINEAGGVFGEDVDYFEGDSGDTSSDKMYSELQDLIDFGADVIIGPSSTAVSSRVIELILDEGLIQISPANTNMILVGFDDGGQYFRMAPADDVQAFLIADLIEEDAVGKVGIFAVDDLYGNSIADRLVAELERRGVEVVHLDLYSPAASSYATNVETMKSFRPDGIVLISFDEGARILRAMVRAGIGPTNRFVYGIDANMGDALGEAFDVSE